MPFQAMPVRDKRLSDLVVFEGFEPSVGYNRRDINITPPAASAPVKLGTIVFRAKSTDEAAPFAVVAAVGDIALTNEYAVVLGDHYGYQTSFVPAAIAAGKFNAVAYTSGPMKIKEYLPKQIHSALNATQFAALAQALEKQGIVVVDHVIV
ncbi:hypothetical protein [Pseudomonas sp. P8_250]|uniref:hypothetical protein n=1 Tax=Pseudomonas sp. P8_250 TaxID=3043446 RepID=UPI002A36B2F2|nr:hypothetical protein [Pseudomonas sp. P8_250]MDX9668773.1 hypothetical protein [Pseudomonas sp. P8_250]